MKFLPVLAVLLMAAPLVAAEVLVFDKYETVSEVQGDKIHIEREMAITNVARNPVIPGELHFKIYEKDGNDKKPIKVTDFTAVNERGTPLSTKVVNKPDETDLSVMIWDPMLPGFSYTFRISYDLYFEASGLLFYELKIPQEETTIPLKGVKQTVLLDDKYHVTYAPETDVSEVTGNVAVSWTGASNQQVIEYSSLPLPQIGIRAVNLFWGFLILLLIGVFALRLRKARKTTDENGG